MKWKPLNALALVAALAGALVAAAGLLSGLRRGKAEPHESGEDEVEAHPS
ncbi:MAG TPA: hypothetical protein VD887_03505 [Allosphingosinicella sp.]|nr:hypothetical protein [Allosphingosinicella sp.]